MKNKLSNPDFFIESNEVQGQSPAVFSQGWAGYPQ